MLKLTTKILTLLASTTAVASAAELSLPDSAELIAESREGYTSQRLPIGPFANAEVPAIWAEGLRMMQAYQSADAGSTTLQVLSPIRAQLTDQGYDVLFECRDTECGGFDFRFSQELLPEPMMHVNLADYRFLSAQRMTDDGPEYLALMVSRNRAKSYVHVTTIGGSDVVDIVETVTATKDDPLAMVEISPDQNIGTVLEREGVAVLEDLNFRPGSAELTDSDYNSLSDLADFLSTEATATVSLVGHTDAVGSLEANFRLSKARASAVRDLLIARFGVLPNQIDAQGVGFLAPVASNTDEVGRSLNRRVEVVLTSTK